MSRPKTYIIPAPIARERAMAARGDLAEAFAAEKGEGTGASETAARSSSSHESSDIDWSKVTRPSALPLSPQTGEHKQVAPAPEQRDYTFADGRHDRAAYERACDNWRATFFGVKGDEYRTVEHKARKGVPFIPARAGGELPDDAERTRQDRLTFAAAERAERETELTDAYLEQLRQKAIEGWASLAELRVLRANGLVKAQPDPFAPTTDQMFASLLNDIR